MAAAMEPSGVIHMSGNRVNYLQRNNINKIITKIDVHSEDVVDFAGKNQEVDSRSNAQLAAVNNEINHINYSKMNGVKSSRDSRPSDECFVEQSESDSINNLVLSRNKTFASQSRSYLEALDLEDGSKILEHISMYRKNVNCYECCYECPLHASIRKAVSLQTLTEKDKNKNKDFLWNRKYRKDEIIRKDGTIWRNCVKQWSKLKYIWRKSKPEVYHRNYGSISSRHNDLQKSMNSNYVFKSKRKSKISLLNCLNCFWCCAAENEEIVPLRKRHRSYTIW